MKGGMVVKYVEDLLLRHGSAGDPVRALPPRAASELLQQVSEAPFPVPASRARSGEVVNGAEMRSIRDLAIEAFHLPREGGVLVQPRRVPERRNDEELGAFVP